MEKGRLRRHDIFSLQRHKNSLRLCSKGQAVFHANNRGIHLSESEQIWGLYSIQDQEESRAVLEFEKC